MSLSDCIVIILAVFIMLGKVCITVPSKSYSSCGSAFDLRDDIHQTQKATKQD